MDREFLETVREEAVEAVLGVQPQLQDKIINCMEIFESAREASRNDKDEVRKKKQWIVDLVKSDKSCLKEIDMLTNKGSEKVTTDFDAQAYVDFMMDGINLFDEQECAAMSMTRK